jgi:hypothetical protein
MITTKTAIKLLLLSNPSLDVEHVQSALSASGIAVTPVLVSYIRNSFLSDLKLLRSVGCPINADRRLIAQLLHQFNRKIVNRPSSVSKKAVVSKSRSSVDKEVVNNTTSSKRVDVSRSKSVNTPASKSRSSVDKEVVNNRRPSSVSNEAVNNTTAGKSVNNTVSKSRSANTSKSKPAARESVNNTTTNTQSLKHRIITLLQSGYRQAAIARKLDVSRAYVCQVAGKYPV